MWTIDEASRAGVFKKGVILGGGRAANYIRLSGLGRLAVHPKLLPPNTPAGNAEKPFMGFRGL